MITDLQSGELPAELSTDVCIIGAGPAGISMALELTEGQLADGQRDVVLLESGGEDYDVRTQALYEGPNIGRDYYPLRHDRIRYFGGTSHHWGGWCVPLVPGDLDFRDWVPDSGWPISWAELERFYPRAQELCELDRPDYDPYAWLEPRFPLLPLNGELLEHYLYKWSPADQNRPPTHFGRVYRDRLAAAERLNVVLHANVTDFECNDAVDHVDTAVVRSLDGNELRVKAKVFVVAAGGLENPRLLLAANGQNPAGLGNDRDLVGRYFMEHLEGVLGHILIDDTDAARWLASYEKRIPEGERLDISAAIRPTFGFQEERQILNAGLVLRSQVDQNSGYVSAKRLALSLKGEGQSNYASDIANVLTDLDEVALWIHHRRAGTNYEFPVTKEPVKIWVNSEQAPNPDSRVMLTDERDELGMPRIALDWRVGAIEKKTLIDSAELLSGEVARLTGMRVELAEWLVDGSDIMPTSEIYGGHHHMGTTRMSDSPQTGVVDSDCRVFGLDNLYIAGSSVFPTGGYANPTLTLVALAVRLAGHIDTRLRADV